MQAVYQWQMTGQNAGEIIVQFLEEQDFENVDVEKFKALVMGVIKESEPLDEILEKYLDRPFSQLDGVEMSILRIGAFELQHQLEVPYRVVLDEGVDLAHRFGAEQSHGFINGVLDKVARQLRVLEVADRANA